MLKRLGLLLMALVLAGGMAAAQADGAVKVYQSSFGAGNDDWYGRGASVFHTTEGTLQTTGRSSDWNSPGRNFELIEGGKYELSVDVRQTAVDSANFMISIAHSKDGAESYENLGRGTAKKDEWTTITGSYEAGAFDQYVLYVETTGAPTLEYEIRNFTVIAPEGLPEAKATAAPMVIEAVENLASLKDAYAGKFDFGAAAPSMAFRDLNLMKLMAEQFSILTPENEMKPDAVLDVAASKKLAAEDETAVAVRFDAAKPLLDYAVKNGIKVHGHTLVWHNQTPEAFFHEGYDTGKALVTRDVMLGRLENYIKAVMDYLKENYPGVVVSWDVVNEAIDDGTKWLRTTSNWYKVVGEDFVARAFEYARKYAEEGTLLYYNDYNTAYAGKREGIIKLLKQLQEEGNIDGYGFQMHHSVGEPPLGNIQMSVRDIAQLGLKLRVSELDVGIGNRTEESYMKQKDLYKAIMELLLKYSDQVEAVQVWGVTDPMSWRRDKYPLLFDGNMNPKPAFYGVLEACE